MLFTYGNGVNLAKGARCEIRAIREPLDVGAMLTPDNVVIHDHSHIDKLSCSMH